MVYGVESSGEVQENEGRHFLLVGSKKKIILNAEKGSFGGVKWSISGLKRGERRKRVHVSRNSSVDNAFEDFGDKVQVRNGSVVGEVLGWEIMLFQKGRDESVLVWSWKNPFAK